MKDSRPNDLNEKKTSIGQSARRGAVVLAALRVGTRLLTAIQLLIFSVIQGTEDTGLIGIGLSTLVAIEVFSHLGVRKALIQRTGNIGEYYPTAFTVQAIRGIVISLIMFLSAPFVAAWFQAPDAIPILQIFSLIPLMRGLINIQTVEFERQLHFGKVVLLEACPPLVDFVITLICLWINPNLYSLVWGKLAGVACLVMFSYWLQDRNWRPSWNTQRFLELNTFGKWVFVSGVIGFLVTRGSDFIAGRLLSTSEFGILTLATMLAITPIMEVGNVVNRVAFPAYSRMQDDSKRLTEAFLNTFLVVSIAVVGIMLVMMLTASDFVQVFMDQRWQAMSWIIPLLAIWGACRALGGATSNLFMALGKPYLASKYHLLMLVMLGILVYPMTAGGGLYGLAITLAATGLTVQTLRYGLVASMLDVSAKRVYAIALTPLGVAALSLLVVWTVVLPNTETLLPQWRLVILPAIGLGIYVAGLFLWQTWSSVPVFDVIASLIPARLRRTQS